MRYSAVFYDVFVDLNGVKADIKSARFDYLTEPYNVGEACLRVCFTIENLQHSDLNEDADNDNGDSDPKYLAMLMVDNYKIQFGNFELDLYSSDVKSFHFKVLSHYLITITVEETSMIREL